ncbi:uncharacterized protein LOC134263799 [Saccostrea cucullata]|uniref:uncharacterized protein LOC134263799 n=1 Tax=Saccostrea cuccullata TaxID=36930 RepID=UPI002ED02012
MASNLKTKAPLTGSTGDLEKTEKCSGDQGNIDKEVSIEAFKNLQESVEAISSNLKYVAEQSESNYDEMYFIRSENTQLRREVDLLRAMLIKMDRKINHMESEITDLRSRSMRDNILIHNFAYTQGENLNKRVPEVLLETLGVEVDFVRIHRNSVRGVVNSRPVSITGKLRDRTKKDELLRAQKAKKSENVNLPFFITSQEPASVVEERKRLYAISDSLRKQNIKSKIEKGAVIMPDGKKYQDPIPKLEAADALQIPVDEVQILDDVKVECTEPTKIRGSEIFATGKSVCSVTEVETLYKKVCTDAYSAAADHRILVYRFMETSGRLCEGYWDDGEHGAGRRLLQYMQSNEILNAGAVITRWSGPVRLGQERFKIMEDHLCDLANLIQG